MAHRSANRHACDGQGPAIREHMHVDSHFPVNDRAGEEMAMTLS